MSKRKRLLLLLLLLPLILVVILTVGFAVWAETGPPATSAAQVALTSDALVNVTQDDWLVFQPVRTKPTTGLILYPGARVDPVAYAPLARAIAAEGYLVVIPPMPLNFAIFAPNVASEIIATFPDITSWALGGHSLGGAMAAGFAGNHPDLVQGLILWAAYPAGSNDLSDSDLTVTSIYGTNDGLATLADIDASAPLLPANTRWVAIAGGNHAQFGSYGSQSGDNPADISAEEQQAQIIQATLETLRTISAQ